MKRLIFLLSIFVCFITLQAQNDVMPKPEVAKDTVSMATETVTYSDAGVEAPIQDIETDVIADIKAAIMTIIGYIDWVLMITFLAICWLTLPLSEGTNIAKWFDWWAKIPKLLQSLIIGIVVTCIFWFLFDYSGKAGLITAFFTLLLDLVLYRIGIDKAIKWIFSKLGVKFDEKPKAVPPVNNNPVG